MKEITKIFPLNEAAKLQTAEEYKQFEKRFNAIQ